MERKAPYLLLMHSVTLLAPAGVESDLSGNEGCDREVLVPIVSMQLRHADG
jgi:hypothetical protein